MPEALTQANAPEPEDIVIELEGNEPGRDTEEVPTEPEAAPVEETSDDEPYIP